MSKLAYKKPMTEIIKLEAADIVVTSGDIGGGSNGGLGGNDNRGPGGNDNRGPGGGGNHGGGDNRGWRH